MRFEIVRIVRRPVVHVLAGEIVGVLAHVERADEDGAGRFEPLDDRRIALGGRRIAIDLGAGDRRKAGDIEQVLHGKRHAGERRQRVHARARASSSVRARASARAPRHRGEGIEQRIARTDAGKRCVDNAFRGAAPGDATAAAISAAVIQAKSMPSRQARNTGAGSLSSGKRETRRCALPASAGVAG